MNPIPLKMLLPAASDRVSTHFYLPRPRCGRTDIREQGVFFKFHGKRRGAIKFKHASYHTIFSSHECARPRRTRSPVSDRRILSDFVKQIVVANYVASFYEVSANLERVQMQQKFDRLTKEWSHDTAHISSIHDMCMHPAYQKIIGIGPKVVPLILRELERSPDHWFWALSSITEENPVPEESWGRIEDMTTAWLNWGLENGYSW